MDQSELRRQIIAIQTDGSLNDAEKAKRRQALLSGSWQPKTDAISDEGIVLWSDWFILTFASLRFEIAHCVHAPIVSGNELVFSADVIATYLSLLKCLGWPFRAQWFLICHGWDHTAFLVSTHRLPYHDRDFRRSSCIRAGKQGGTWKPSQARADYHIWREFEMHNVHGALQQTSDSKFKSPIQI